MLLQAHRWKADEALTDEVIDAIAKPEELLQVCLEIANKWRSKGKAGVYGILREELYGDAIRAFRNLSYVHARNTNIGLAKM
jgi:enoyl-CoA hydratase/carnithine racemase